MKLPFSLTKSETHFLKGVGIFLIVFHNFLHVLPPFLGENEMEFEPTRVWNYLDTLIRDPAQFVLLFFSYFGHFGVQIFVFVSGYGLTRSFYRKEQSLLRFTASHFLKIYLILCLCVAARLLINMAKNLELPDPDIVSQMMPYLTLTNNFYRETLYSAIGPWWFFGLIIQLYLLFPILLRVIEKYRFRGYLVLIASVYLLLFVLNPIASQNDFPLYANSLGHLPEFCLGIWFAASNREDIKIQSWLFALVLFSLGNFYEIFFPFSFLAITVVLISPLIALSRHCTELPRETIVFLGEISLYMFVINAPLRRLLSPFAGRSQSAVEAILYSVLHFILVVGVSWVLSVLVSTISAYVKKTVVSFQRRQAR